MAVAIPVGIAMWATQLPGNILHADAGNALAELAARSPGMRIGGVALKAKTPRAALASPAARPARPGLGPKAQVAAVPVLATPVPPTAIAVAGVPTLVLPDFAEGAEAAGPITSAPIGFGGGPGGGGFVVGGPSAGGGGSTPGLPGGNTPDGGVVTPPTTLPPPPPASAVPEPSVWFMLIIGFGVVGSGMRRRLRVSFAG